ncbi:MAG: TlpA family protein disulfide reductase, partial [Deltaproteobacteria bacterium]|nr:TlpA family protein disulfide reductase [Deltaproteobacteria bacterium]
FSAPSRAQLPVIEELLERYSGQGLEVFGIGVDGEPLRTRLRQLAREEGLSFSVLLDPATKDDGFALSLAYGVRGTPTLYVIDRDGKVAFVGVGWTSEAALDDAVRKASAP